jgi:hypothetical protein
MKTLLSLLTLMFFSAESFAALKTVKVADLPKPIVEMQAIQAKQGVCEARWPDLSEIHGIKTEELDQWATLWLVPCAHWSENVGWGVYVTVKESSHPDGFLTKAIRFVSYHPYEGIVARDLIHNIDWDSANKVLRAQYFMNGSELCGSRAEYKWHGGYQTLQVKTLLKKDDCRDSNEPWKPVFAP